jgi:hypothetical protein
VIRLFQKSSLCGSHLEYLVEKYQSGNNGTKSILVEAWTPRLLKAVENARNLTDSSHSNYTAENHLETSRPTGKQSEVETRTRHSPTLKQQHIYKRRLLSDQFGVMGVPW